MKKVLMCAGAVVAVVGAVIAGSFYCYISIYVTDETPSVMHVDAGTYLPMHDNLPTFYVKTGIKEVCSQCSYKAEVYINGALYKSWGYSASDSPVNDTRNFKCYPGNDSGIDHSYTGYIIIAQLSFYSPGLGWTVIDDKWIQFQHNGFPPPIMELELALVGDQGVE